MRSFEEIDAIARAICNVINDDEGGYVYSAVDEDMRNKYRRMAIAALDARDKLNSQEEHVNADSRS